MVAAVALALGAAFAAPTGVRADTPPWTRIVGTRFDDVDGAVFLGVRVHAARGRDTTGAMLLDTGIGFLGLDHATASRLEVTDPHGGGGIEFATGRVDSISFDGGVLDSLGPVVSLDAGVVRRSTGRSVIGLLGEAPLQHAMVVIDYVAESLAVFRRGPDHGSRKNALDIDNSLYYSALRFSDSASIVPFELAGDGKIVVTARFSSPAPPHTGSEVRLIVDTGATKTALFEHALSKAVPRYRRWPRLRGFVVPTLMGASSASIARVPAIEVRAVGGWMTVTGMDAALMDGPLPEQLSQAVGTPIAGLLGYTFLREFRVGIDFPEHRLVLERHGRDVGRRWEYSQPGIQLEWTAAGPRVLGVISRSPAARAGIRAGDLLRRIAGRDVTHDDLIDVIRALEGPPGTAVGLEVVRDGHAQVRRVIRRQLL
jgi:PDZ domain-containing protein/aspartyl protease